MVVLEYIDQHWVKFTFPSVTRGGLNLLPKVGPSLFKQYPGVQYAPDLGYGFWKAPVEAISWIEGCAKTLGLSMGRIGTPPKAPQAMLVKDSRLYPYQQDAVANGLEDRAHLFSLEMGLGKTAVAIEIFKRVSRNSILVACPAVAYKTWEKELDKWWSNRELECYQVKHLKDTPLPGKINIVSHRGLDSRFAEYKWDIIVLDESHYYKKSGSLKTKAAIQIRKNNLEALMLCLTGTPISDNPKDLWQQVDLLFPGRFGSYHSFCSRYCEKIPNKHRQRGYDFGDLAENVEELRNRLTYVSTRVVKSEVSYLLPPYTIQTLEIEGCTAYPGKLKEKTYNIWAAQIAPLKVQKAADWVNNQLDCGVKHICVFTHLRKTVHALAKELPKDVLTLKITGAVAVNAREALIEQAYEEKRSVVICTMASVGIAINALANYTRGLFLEMSYYPNEILQAISRLNRLSSKEAVDITFLLSSDGPDQRIARALKRKIQDAGKVLKAGHSEKALLETLADDKDWQWKMMLRLERDEEEIDGFVL